MWYSVLNTNIKDTLFLKHKVSMNWIIPLSVLIIMELIADILAKEWSLKQNLSYLGVWSIVCYVVANMYWLLALKNGSGLARGAVIFSVASAMIAILIGLAVYKEPVSMYGVTGICLGVLSIVFLSLH